jgi:hypothetical protein
MDESTRLSLAAALIIVPLLGVIIWYGATYRTRRERKLRRRGIKSHR